MSCTHTILIIEDESMLRLTLGDHLRDRGHHVLEAEDGVSGLDLFREHAPDLVTLDLRMTPLDGHEVLAAIRRDDMETPVIIISGQGEMHDVINALRAGASDYLQKPITDMTILDRAVERALERVTLRRGASRLSHSFLATDLERPQDFAETLTNSPRMHDVFRYCEAVAQSGEPVLITGETGVGKELLARALHRASRRPGPFVAVNVAGLDDHAFSDTLVGHVRGAFTGAEAAREGFMERAAKGTLFLDEVGELPPQSQIRLLRVLQEREFHPLGSDVPRPLQARILTATNKSLAELRGSDMIRSDFFFRIATHSVALPPLRERVEDIPPLLDHFLTEAAEALGKPVPEVSPHMIRQLAAYPFPGNIRELKALVLDALSRCQSGVLALELPPADQARGRAMASCAPGGNCFATSYPLPTIRAATDALIEEALRRTDGVQKRAAALLGITPQSLNERLKRREKSTLAD